MKVFQHRRRVFYILIVHKSLSCGRYKRIDISVNVYVDGILFFVRGYTMYLVVPLVPPPSSRMRIGPGFDASAKVLSKKALKKLITASYIGLFQ